MKQFFTLIKWLVLLFVFGGVVYFCMKNQHLVHIRLAPLDTVVYVPVYLLLMLAFGVGSVVTLLGVFVRYMVGKLAETKLSLKTRKKKRLRKPSVHEGQGEGDDGIDASTDGTDKEHPVF